MGRTSSCLVLFPVLLLCSGRLDVRPDRSMFFRYDDVTLSCSDPDSSAASGPGRWRVKRNTSTRFSDPCEIGWGTVNGTSCTIKGLYTADSALYWCESDLNHRSSTVNITVTSHPVILSAPVHPVLQGAPFSLLCLYKERDQVHHSISFEASFFKDGEFIGKWNPANMTVPMATPGDGGLYRCEHPSRGRSTEVPLTVSDVIHFTVRCDPGRVVADVGSDATLSCRVEPSMDLTHELLLCYLLLDKSKNVFVWRNRVEVFVHQHKDFRSRVQIQKEELKEGRIMFMISNISPKDEGIYCCLVKVWFVNPTVIKGYVKLDVRTEGQGDNIQALNTTTSSPLTVATSVTPTAERAVINETPPPPPPPEPGLTLYRLLCFTLLFLLYTVILCIGLCAYCRQTRARVKEEQTSYSENLQLPSGTKR